MLIGRAREVGRLDQALESAAAGRGGMVVLCGEAGIGKTRLADEVADRALRHRGFQVAWGRAWETGGAPPYWPWIECLRALVDAGAGQLPPAVTALLAPGSGGGPQAEGLRTAPDRERFELFEGLAAILRAAARERPLLVVLDDLHAADLASLELLAFVARGLRSTRVVVLGTWRVVEGGRSPVGEVLGRVSREAEILVLDPLRREEVAEFVRHELGTFDAALASRVFEVSEGNPLFAREVLQALSRGDGPGTLVEGGGVEALVRGRLSGASAATLMTLEQAAAQGREVDPVLLAAATGASPDVVTASLHDGAARGLLVPRGTSWAFSHVLVREAIYRGVAPERRRVLHHRLAGALDLRVATGREDLLAPLAHHLLQALPAGDLAAAMSTARRAAERARSQLAHDEATGLLERALAAQELHGDPHDPDHAELLLALGWAATEGGHLERGREVFRRVAAFARASQDGRLLARAALGQGGAYVFAEVRGELVDLLREALLALGEAQQPGDRRLVARLLARLAGALTPSPEPEEPLGLARRALALTRDEQDLRTRVDVDLGAGSALIDFAPPAERIAVDQRLLADARLSRDRVLELRALTRLACACTEAGEVLQAAAAIAARAAIGDALGSLRYRWATPLLRSMAAMLEGRFDDCEALAAEAADMAADPANDDPNAARCVALHRLCLSVVAGRPADLTGRLADAIRVLAPLADRGLHAWAVAIGAATLQQRERALEAIRTVLYTRCAGKARNVRSMIAAAASTCAGPEENAELHAWLAAHHEDASFGCWGPFAFVCGPPIAHALATSAFACGRFDDGLRHGREALALCARAGARGHEAWVHLTLGEGLSARGHAPAAQEHLRQALDLANELGMPLVDARARALLGEERRTLTPAPTFSLTRSGAAWTVHHAGRSFPLKDLRGVGMLARLVASPGAEVHALDLAGGIDGDDGVIDLGDAGELLDPRAREAYRARIADLNEEIDEAEAFADPGRLQRLNAELDALTAQLASAFGLGGRARRSGSAAERARITVQRRVREAIHRIAATDAELGRHLDQTIRTGTFCAYEPEGRKIGP